MKIRAIINLLRPKQWIKNSFIFAPLLFSRVEIDFNHCLNIGITFLIFSLAASAVYIYNDIKDIDKDKVHPTKSKKRPLASGAIKIGEAYFLLIGILILLSVYFFLNQSLTSVIVLIYLTLNYFYTIKLKYIPIFDVFSIATGFVLRVMAGNASLETNFSEWMIISTFCLSLYLATIKRRQEILNSGLNGRAVLGKYTISFVDRMAEFSSVSALLFYSMFSILQRPIFVYTIPLVMFGLLRYWYIVELYKDGESPTDVLYKDPQIQIVLMFWVILVFILGWLL